MRGGSAPFAFRLTAHKPCTDVARGPRVVPVLARLPVDGPLLVDAEPARRAAGYIVQTLRCFMPCSWEHKCHAGTRTEYYAALGRFCPADSELSHFLTMAKAEGSRLPSGRKMPMAFAGFAVFCRVLTWRTCRPCSDKSHGAAMMGISCHVPQSRPCMATATRFSWLSLPLSCPHHPIPIITLGSPREERQN